MTQADWITAWELGDARKIRHAVVRWPGPGVVPVQRLSICEMIVVARPSLPFDVEDSLACLRCRWRVRLAQRLFGPH